MDLTQIPTEELLSMRRVAMNKRTQAHNMQMAKKLILNAAFGACSNEYFLFFNDDIAESITLSGQLAVRWVERAVNKYLNNLLGTSDFDYVIAIDTDSMYLNLDSFVQKFASEKSDQEITDFLDKVAKTKLQEVINESLLELKELMNAPRQKLNMKREAIANKGIWKAKKKYIINLLDNEGVREDKIKMVGISAIQSSTPEICRSKIKDGLKISLEGTNSELIKFIEDFWEDFKQRPFVDVAKPISANNLDEYFHPTQIYKPKCPYQVKGALLYNKLVQQHNLEGKYSLVYSGDKVKFTYLKKPNPVSTELDGISVPNIIPPEFKLDDYIDYEKQFETVFVKPLKDLVSLFGWKVKETATIEDWL